MKPKVIAIVGPTTSGKTSLSIHLAQKFNGEVISADARQVYRGLDIGTGKVTQEEMEGIPHHLLDVANPEDTYTVADYVRDGREKISEILSRGNIPFIVGGTFFYIDALLGKISLPKVAPHKELRKKLEELSNEELMEMLKKNDPVRAETIDKDNKRRLVRALEIVEAITSVPSPQSEELFEVLMLGIQRSKEELQENIHKRLVARLDRGMIDEVRKLNQKGLSYERMEELGLEYRYIAEFLQGKISETQMCTVIETKSMQYAKRQMTWLKRDEVKKVNGKAREAGLGHAGREGALGYKNIVWVDPHNILEIDKVVTDFLKRQ